MLQAPGGFPAGETRAVPQRGKKNRLVKRPISFSSPNATNALTAPMITARREMEIERGVMVKSPSLADARFLVFTSVRAIVPPNYGFQCLDQGGTVISQLIQMTLGEFFQLPFSVGGQMHQHLAPVRRRPRA